MARKQIERLSPHQNGKVLGIIAGVIASSFAIPFSLIFAFAPSKPETAPPGGAYFFLLAFPAMYFIGVYLYAAGGCWLYNLMFKYIGGIEFETADSKTDA